MKESIDFKGGRRGKHAGVDLKVLGSGTEAWAVCVRPGSSALSAFRLYRIEAFQGSDEVRVQIADGTFDYFPAEWFAPVEVPNTTLKLLEKAG